MGRKLERSFRHHRKSLRNNHLHPRLVESHLVRTMLPKSLRPLYPYLKKYRRGFAWGTLCVLLLNGIWVQFPKVLGKAIDYLDKGNRSLGTLALYASLMIAIVLSKGVFQFL